jgi:hypothetical protein
MWLRQKIDLLRAGGSVVNRALHNVSVSTIRDVGPGMAADNGLTTGVVYALSLYV